MQTDWLIVRRLAAELERRLRGARIRAAGLLPDGRFGLRTPAGLVAFDPFGATPLVTLEPDAPLSAAPGWPRAFAEALTGLRIERVAARNGDRLIALDCSARSRFGVENGYRLVAELVPRYGNLVLLKGRTVVSAAREFAAGGRTLRTVAAGEEYEAPPLPAPEAAPRSLAESFAAAGEPAERLRAGIAALRASVPLVPRLVAESLVSEALATGAPAQLAERTLERARALVSATEGDPSALGDVFAYVDEAGRVVAAHVVPLAQFAGLREQRASELLPLLSAALAAQRSQRGEDALAARRASLLAAIEKRRALLGQERGVLEREAGDDAARERLRASGDLLFTYAPAIAPRATAFAPPDAPENRIELDPELDAKGNAREFFRRYKKAVARGKHAARRAAELAREEAGLEELAWEAERADAAALLEIADEFDRLQRPKAERRPRAPARGPLEVPIAADARILVGRSPRGNAELTFRVARPEDLWFHARATPGAHVVLHLDSARPALARELSAAAELAAFHSKARAADKVSVDYTERKHVRRQAGAAPGRVWYTNARTLVVTPRDVAAS